jgi:hypothetical protein
VKIIEKVKENIKTIKQKPKLDNQIKQINKSLVYTENIRQAIKTKKNETSEEAYATNQVEQASKIAACQINEYARKLHKDKVKKGKIKVKQSTNIKEKAKKIKDATVEAVKKIKGLAGILRSFCQLFSCNNINYYFIRRSIRIMYGFILFR